MPIGKGQRELLLEIDRKDAIAMIQSLIKGGYGVYVAIGQKTSTVAYNKVLNDTGAMDYTTVVLSTANEVTFAVHCSHAGCNTKNGCIKGCFNYL